MNLLLVVSMCAVVALSQCEEAKDGKSDLLLMEVEAVKPKRQVEQARAIGATTQHLYGAAPGHYVLRTAPKEPQEPEPDYLSILRQIESGSLQPAAAQDRPAIQQYLLPRPQQAYITGQSAEPKLIQIQPKRPVYAQNVQQAQNLYQNARTPLVLRPSQAVRPSVQGIYTTQGFIPSSPTHALHEARVQAALSVADDKQYAGQGAAQPAFQYIRPQAASSVESSFEKELAQLVAANQAQELKVKPEQVQYVQQAPQKQYVLQPAKPKQYTLTRPEAQAPKYVAPVVAARAKPQKPLPQQYLIETTNPQPVPQRQAAPQPRPQVQYYQVATEEPRYYEAEQYSEKASPMRIVPAPQLQNAQPQYQYRPVAQKETNIPPAYLQYYQSIKAQADEATSANDVKLDAHVPRFASKAQPTTQAPVRESPSYITKYEPQTKPEDQQSYVRYKAAKPQLTSQFAADDEGLIQALFAQSIKNSQQGFSSSAKTASTESKPYTVPSHSSIFVSKALTPKKKTSRPAVEQTEETESDEVQTVRLPPPKNNKVYTQEEFQALVSAGYSVTPIPVTDEDDSSSAFSPAPENYPGHSKYQPTPTPEVQTYASATQVAPRTRKVPRRRPAASSQRFSLQTENSESETQPRLSYAYPLETQETVRYGMKKQVRNRGQQREREEEAES